MASPTRVGNTEFDSNLLSSILFRFCFNGLAMKALAPQLLLAETANVLLRKRRRGELSSSELRDLLQAVESLPIRYFEHEPLLLAACVIAEARGLSAYDALYLALAERHGARVLTSDARLDKAARDMGLC